MMTYCVAMMLERGLVFMADTRTNAGLDNVATFRKLFHWSKSGERDITLATAGNLATTQAVVSLLEERNKAPEERAPTLLKVPTMFQAARLVGETLREVIAQQAGTGPVADSPFSATMLLGGQIAGSPPKLFLIYPEGNFIEAGEDTPFLQIGETKYGRPILVRAHDPKMSFEAAVRLLLVSFDSTIKANLTVGPPLDMRLYETDSLKPGLSRRFAADDPYFVDISNGWGNALKLAFDSLPDLTLDASNPD